MGGATAHVRSAWNAGRVGGRGATARRMTRLSVLRWPRLRQVAGEDLGEGAVLEAAAGHDQGVEALVLVVHAGVGGSGPRRAGEGAGGPAQRRGEEGH